MKKIMNNSDNYDSDVVAGFIRMYENNLVFPNGDLSSILLKDKPEKNQCVCIGICDGGHMPAFAGYIKKGILNGASIGKVFKAPNAEDIYKTAKLANMGDGVLLIPMQWNQSLKSEVDKAVNRLKKQNIDARVIEIRDDCMQPKNDISIRISGAGIFLACKIAGAAAMSGMNIDEIEKLLIKVNKNMRTAMNITSSFSLPKDSNPYISFDDNMMQVGVGLHGEEGFETIEMPKAYTVAEHLFRHRINKELNVQAGEEIVLLINDPGSSTLDELLIIYQEEVKQFELKGATIVKSYVGRYVTTLDMDGVSITALRVDEQMKQYLLATEDTLLI